jgi:hypothetical protein
MRHPPTSLFFIRRDLATGLEVKREFALDIEPLQYERYNANLPQ